MHGVKGMGMAMERIESTQETEVYGQDHERAYTVRILRGGQGGREPESGRAELRLWSARRPYDF